MRKKKSTSTLSKKEAKRAISSKPTKEFIDCLEKVIKDRHVRKEAISMIRALDGKKIRNTSGV